MLVVLGTASNPKTFVATIVGKSPVSPIKKITDIGFSQGIDKVEIHVLISTDSMYYQRQ